jgi:hypothetical protein
MSNAARPRQQSYAAITKVLSLRLKAMIDLLTNTSNLARNAECFVTNGDTLGSSFELLGRGSDDCYRITAGGPVVRSFNKVYLPLLQPAEVGKYTY